MKPTPIWQYDEMRLAGVDYSSVEQVAAYDSMHKKFRDYAKGTDEVIRRLGIDSNSTYDWIMEGIIRKSGFQIDTVEDGKVFQTIYVCTKN